MDSTNQGIVTQDRPPDVFSFLDYRAFLRAYFEFKKKKNRNFSYESWARKANLMRPHLQMIIKGTRQLVTSKTMDVARACGLTECEQTYFVELVLWNQCDDEKIKRIYWERLVALAPRENFYYLRKEEEEIILRWYSLALLELIRCKNFRNDPEWIKRKLLNRVSSEEIVGTLNDLQRLGLITPVGDKFRISRPIVMVEPDHISKELMTRFHEKNIPIGARALRNVDRALRDISTTSIAIPMSQVELFKSKIQTFKSEMLELAESLKEPDEVFQLNIQFFAMTDPKGGE